MKRFLALLVAVAMVLLAVLVRGLLDGNGTDGTGTDGNDTDGNGTDGNGTDGSGLELICGPQLLAACNSLAGELEGVRITLQDESDTAEAIAAGTVTLGAGTAWLAAGDWPAITAAGISEGASNLEDLESTGVLGRSPAVMVARTDRMEAISSSCTQPDWGCVGAAAGSAWTELGGSPQWGRIEIGLPEPTAASGMTVVNQAVASEVGTTDFATNDLADPAYSSWFSHLAETSGSNASSTSPLVEFVSRPASLSVVGALEAEAIEELAGVASADTLTVLAPDPIATADVRLWSSDRAALDSVLDRLGSGEPTGAEVLVDFLEATGWRVVGPGGDLRAPEAASIGAQMLSSEVELPDSTGLPSPGTIYTVNERFESDS